MSDRTGLSAVQPTPTGVIRAVQERLDALERDLFEARAALTAAETELVAAQRTGALDPVALTTAQVAQLLGLSRSTVTTMIGRREITSIKVGGSRRVLRRDLDAYLAQVAPDGAA